MKFAMIPLLLSLLFACSVTQKYQKPEVDTNNLYRTKTVLDSTSIGTLSWKKLFTDPQLQSYINEGLQNNLDMKVALQNIVSAESSFKQSKAGFFPTLSLGSQITYSRYSKNSQFGSYFSDLTQYEFSGKISWEADIWGKIKSSKKSALANYLQTQAAQRAVQSELVAQIASTYFQILATQEQIRVVKQNLENRVKSVEVISALKQAGNVNEVAVKQTEAQQYSTELTLKDLKYNLSVLENAFNFLLNKKSGEVEKGDFNSQSIQVDVKAGIPAIMLSNRPDVQAAELNFRKAFEKTNVARSSLYPSLTIGPSLGLQSVELERWFDPASFFLTVVGGLTQPVFNQRKNRTNLEIAKSNQQTAYLQFEKTVLTAGKEVSDALASYENETEKLVVRKQQLDALKLAADYSDELLLNGQVNYLEVLTAKDDELSTEISYIDNKFKQLSAVITLYKALGGGSL